MTSALVLRGVEKSFGTTRAVDHLDLVVPRGALYGIIGPNGAGKTTTLRMILSILLPNAGTIEVLGGASALDAKDRIGYLPEERGVYRRMQVAAFLKHMAVLKGVPRERTAALAARWLERVGLADVAAKRCEELSKGMQQKVQFIAAVSHEPDLLVLDEPFSGLDPVSSRLLRDLIVEERARGTTILFSTHVMHQAEQLCEHIVMLHGGRKVLDDPLSTIRRRHDPRAIALEPYMAETDVAAALRDMPDVAAVTQEDGRYRIDLRAGTDLGAATREVAARVPPARLELIRPTLEDIFVEIVTDSGSA
jgi:ABC-2 type transport system ATP-binding protein